MDFGKIEFLTFDCYGTLINWERGIVDGMRPFLERHGIDMENESILSLYSQFEPEAEHGTYKPYKDVLRAVMHRFAQHFGIELNAGEERTLIESLPQWPPFSDTVTALDALRAKFKLVVLSNIDRDLIQETAKVLGNPFFQIITAQDVQSYKPAHQNFLYAAAQLGLNKENHCHVAQSLYHDIAPAKALGMNTVWIDRRKGKAGTGATPPSDARADLTFGDLKGFTEFALQ